MKKDQNTNLSPKQRELLKDFLLTILPPMKAGKRNSNNELSTIATALDRWFNRHFGFRVGVTPLGELFEELSNAGYTMRPMGVEDDPDTKKQRVVPPNEHHRSMALYASRGASFLYVNVHPTRVKHIRKLTYHQPENTSVEKLIDAGPISDELRDFIVKHF